MSDRKIIESLLKITGTQLSDQVTMELAEVSSVNLEDRTCTCITLGGSADVEVVASLQADVEDGRLYIPKVGSVVLIGYTKRLAPHILLFSALERVLYDVGQSALEMNSNGKIRLNDGSFGGLTKTRELQTELGKMTAILKALSAIINGAPIPEAGSGAPSSFQVALKSAISGLPTADFSKIENTQIIHGK